MDSIFYSYLQTPIGRIEIKANTYAVTSISFVEEQHWNEQNNIKIENLENTISILAKKQLEEYFSGLRTHFHLPLNFDTTEFRQKVWNTLQQIPYGKTISYTQLAIKLGDIKCIRAAATANGKNKFPIVVPCHRVIGKDGSLVGFNGGIWRKKWLLELEQNRIGNELTLF